MLKIMPKIDECQYIGEQEFLKYIDDRLEIQLLHENYMVGFESVKYILSRFPNLKYVTLHLPERYVDIGFLHSCYKYEVLFIKLIVECIKYTSDKDLYIDILFHGRMNYTAFEDIGGIDFLKYITYLVRDTKVGFLIENSLFDTCISNYEKDTVVRILDAVKSDKLSMCLDICHLQASESYMLQSFELSKEQKKRIKNIHFSMTVDNDGYRDKRRTHGRVHDSIDSLKKDLKYLEEKGIKLNKVNIVTEINEEDYQYRPDMIKELELFEQLKNNN